ncbi:hypothetical protein [Planobispora takensis]|uniref:Uncharacterized protein n=1 Tax=Planobispora takensis TaxID=1367882 RepID=A0A8J3WS67_9ACTN|nr:hypothetical protein [Planobispora takensis]GII00354.1 hypothetical protein Pta02_23620 [Planobispora takensis]
MKSRFTMAAVAALVLTALLGTAGPAGARSASGTPAPACLAYGQDWRYTTATNGCTESLTFRVVYRDGERGTCVSLAPGRTSTVGSGYAGPHGHVDHLELCADDSTVFVHYDTGFGNAVTIRGDVPPLSWHSGLPCVNRAADLWECTVTGIPGGQRFAYKVLLNDRVWSTGADYTGTGGGVHHIQPAF